MTKPRRRPGRPTRAEASAHALRGVNLDHVDPLRILRSIAADTSLPASARVAAARALLAYDVGKAEESDLLIDRALVVLRGGRT